MAAALAAAKEAVQVQSADSRQRFESVNEFRAQQADIIRTFMPRSEAELAITRSTERIQDLAAQAHDWVTRSEVAVAVDRSSERIGDLTSRLDKAESRLLGIKENRAGLYGVIGAVGAVLGILVVAANFISTR